MSFIYRGINTQYKVDYIAVHMNDNIIVWLVQFLEASLEQCWVTQTWFDRVNDTSQCSNKIVPPSINSICHTSPSNRLCRIIFIEEKYYREKTINALKRQIIKFYKTLKRKKLNGKITKIIDKSCNCNFFQFHMK